MRHSAVVALYIAGCRIFEAGTL